MTKTDVINMIDCMRAAENKNYENYPADDMRTHDNIIINSVYDRVIDNLNMLFPED